MRNTYGLKVWFSSHEFLETVRNLDKQPMHVICGIRPGRRKYGYKGDSLNAGDLHKVLKSEGKKSVGKGILADCSPLPE
ncbi:Hypothetical protein DEACI_3308 [Acididesulfobacillus acetoxydans]|uniref:Uncharacterized protein n=1 Tax=Acididesulfobacillus acetoxydans TaxID=1561005 RepID=A0A8S0W9I6_9FIRM|nr:Hypothetical protein DEACI_3308 [Acididesulfobacillus acetoxydans]CEJ09174.1 Hypothetical protein DEACI_3657 [Acididesulfobacillus acetoxydans]